MIAALVVVVSKFRVSLVFLWSAGAASSVATDDAGVSWDAAELSRMVVDAIIQEVLGALIGSDRSDGISGSIVRIQSSLNVLPGQSRLLLV